MITADALDTSAETALPQNAAPFVRTRLILLFYMVAGLYSFAPSSFGPLMPYIRADLHLDYTVAALHFSALALGVIISGTVGDKVLALVGRKRSLWGGLAGAAVGITILLSAHVAYLTIFGFWLTGLFGSILGQTIDTVFAEQLGEQRTIAITETNIVVSTCAIMAPLMVGIVAQLGLNWRTTLILLIALFAVAGITFRNDPVPEQTDGQETSENGRLVRAAESSYDAPHHFRRNLY